jgi:putative hydrolase of the HAD superfamily
MLFDADGVLQTLEAGWLDELTAFGGEDFVIALFTSERRAMAGAEDFRDVAREVIGEFGLAATVDDVVGVANRIVVDQDMIAAVQRLRAGGVRCALATNQQNVRGAYMQTALGYADAFDAHFYSFELGVAKPDPGYFRAIVERLEVVPGEVLFVDDKETNVQGAREAGLVAELFPHSGGVDALRPILAVHGLA